MLHLPHLATPDTLTAASMPPGTAPAPPPEHAIPGIAGGIDPLSALLLFVAAAVLVYIAVSAWPRPGARAQASRFASALPNALLAVAVAAIAFQVVHVLEHMLQFAYLAMNPAAPAWLTPWAIATRDALGAAVVQGQGAPSAPDEVLHFVGNSIFLIGLVALAVYARLTLHGRGTHRGPLHTTLWLQGAHLAEHTVLTVSALALGTALGLSNLFGLVSPGPGAATWYRVTLHMLVNLAASTTAVLALIALLRDVRDAHGSTSDHPLPRAAEIANAARGR